MNKLTDEEREDWKEYRNYLQKNCRRSEAIVDAREICALIDSEKAGWEEVERLQGQLQDALTVISNALTDVMDMLAVSEMERRNMELCPQCNMLSLHDELQAAIDRIHGGSEQNE